MPTTFIAPRCQRCGEVPSFVVGLPVTVTVHPEGVATIATDTDELADHAEPLCACTGAKSPLPCDLSDEDVDRVLRILGDVAQGTAPSLDYDLAGE